MSVGESRSSNWAPKQHRWPRRSCPPGASSVTGIALGADDSLLVTAGDGTALLSTLRPVDLIDQVCAAPLSPQVAAAWPRDIPGSAESACPEK